MTVSSTSGGASAWLPRENQPRNFENRLMSQAGRPAERCVIAAHGIDVGQAVVIDHRRKNLVVVRSGVAVGVQRGHRVGIDLLELLAEAEDFIWGELLPLGWQLEGGGVAIARAGHEQA